MEVSGKRKERKSFSASRDSAEDFLLFCIPCDSEGVREPAHGYCKNCKEHLCETCFKHHRKPAPSRNHVLLDKDSMPKVPSVSTKQDDFDHCPEHGDEKLKFYCKNHSNIVCGVCVPLNHRMCKVDYIPNLSKNILEEDELTGLIAELTTFQDACKSKIKKANENMKATAQNHERLLKEIKHFRKELNAFLDKIELNITKEADSLLTAHQDVVKKSSSDLEDIRKEIEVNISRLESLKQENHLYKLFVEMKTTQKQLQAIRVREIASSRANEFCNLRFVSNQALLEMLQSQKSLGNLIQVDSTESKIRDSGFSTTSTPSEDKTVLLKYIDEINVWSPSDVKENHVTGLEYINQDRLVVSDYNNCKVKVYDIVKSEMVSVIEIKERPFDVTAISDNKIAVTVPDKKCIYLMSVTSTSITSDKKINVNAECCGIACSQGKLVVACDITPGKVLIINLNGKLLQTFCGDGIFRFPTYITTNSAGTHLYISDCSNEVNAVQQLDWQGNVVNKYKQSKYGEKLQGVCELDDGTFLVCLRINDGNKIVRLSSSCKPCKVTVHENVGKWSPKAVSYCKETRMLYISYSEEDTIFSSNRIKVFKVEWR